MSMKLRALVLPVIATTLVLCSCGSNTSSTSSMSGMKHEANQSAIAGGTFLSEPMPADILALTLTDADGKKFTFESLKGKYVVFANFLTSCQEICPMTTANLRDIGDAITASPLASKVVVLDISVDAKRDTAERLRKYIDLYSSTHFNAATSDNATLAKFWSYFGAPFSKQAFAAADLKSLPLDWMTGKPNEYDVMHPDLVAIVDDKSNWAWLDLGAPQVGTTIPAKLKSYLSEEGLKNLKKPEGVTWDTKAVLGALSQLTGVKL